MIKRFMNNLFIAVIMLLSSLTYAQLGPLFNITESGASASADLLLCLNGKGALSCQNYHASAQTLKISTAKNHNYPAAGIKVSTPGYNATGCTPNSNGYCLFAVNSQTPTTILLHDQTSSKHTIGGTVSGLIGSVSLQNNSGDTLTQNSDGSFTFATPVAQRASYQVTVSTQPATQTCTVNNGAGTMGNANVINVQITCSTNSYTVSGTVSGLIGSVSLQNNSGDTLTQNSDGSFTFATPVAQGASYQVTVSTQPAAQTCAISNGTGIIGSSNIINVGVSCTTYTTTLSVDNLGTIPVGNGSGSITITNTGTTYAAMNVSVTLPSGWTSVTKDDSNCTSIAPNNGTCTISFTTTAPYIAQGNIQVTGDNISNTPTTALAFTVEGYLVWEVTSASTVQVVDSVNVAEPYPAPGTMWGGYGTAIGPTAQSVTDGVTNTSAIINGLGTGSSYAALLCYQSTNGGASIGDWYLPAICQIAGPGGDADCASGLASIDVLVKLGFTDLCDHNYWSSTEWNYSYFPTISAWQYDSFCDERDHANSYLADKNSSDGARCVRSLTY